MIRASAEVHMYFRFGPPPVLTENIAGLLQRVSTTPNATNSFSTFDCLGECSQVLATLRMKKDTKRSGTLIVFLPHPVNSAVGTALFEEILISKCRGRFLGTSCFPNSLACTLEVDNQRLVLW